MRADLLTLKNILKADTGFTKSTFKDMTEDDIKKTAENKSNSMQWIFGHMIASRYIIGQLIGMTDTWEMTPLFSRGSKFEPNGNYPSLDELFTKWDEISDSLFKHFETISEETLASKSPYDFPIDDKTILGAVAFLSLHDSYHVGQLAFMRKYFGFTALAD